MAGGDFLVWLEAEEGVGLAEGKEGVALLQALNGEVAVFEDTAQVVRAVAIVMKDGVDLRGDAGGLGIWVAHPCLERWSNKQLICDVTRHGIAREAEDEAAFMLSKEEGFAGLDLDAPEIWCDAEGLEGGFDLIMIPHGDAATEEKDVIFCQGLPERGDGGGKVIGTMNGGGVVDALRSEHGLEHEAVAIVNVAGLQGLAGWLEFIARADDGDSWGAVDAEAGEALGGQYADLARGDEISTTEDDLADAEICPGTADVLAGLHGVLALNVGACALDILLHDDGICPAGHGRAGEDADGVAGGAMEAEIPPSRLLPADDQGCGGGVAFGGVEGVAIHHGIVKTWQGDGGQEVHCGMATEALQQGYLDAWAGGDGGEHAGAGFSLGDH